MFSARRWQTSQPSRIGTDRNLTTIDLPPKEAGTALGIGLTNLGSSWIDDFLSNFVDVAPTQLVVAQVSPESPAAGLLSPGDVVVSINGIGGDGCMTAEAASNFIRSATMLKMQVIQKDVASMVTRERDSALAPTRWLAIGLIGLVVLGMFGGLLAGTMLPWLNLSEAKHKAMRLSEQASASLVEGKKAQRALRLQENSLTSQITKLQATAASNSAQANARLHLLLEQQANISAQRDEWHAKTRKWSQEVKNNSLEDCVTRRPTGTRSNVSSSRCDGRYARGKRRTRRSRSSSGKRPTRSFALEPSCKKSARVYE